MTHLDRMPCTPARRRLGLMPAGLAAVLAALAPTATRAEAPTNVVYVMTNKFNPAIGNAVLAYTRGPDGALSLLGTFPTGGVGPGPSFDFGPNASDRNLALDDPGSTLFAVNGGSDSVAAFRVNRDGSLTAIPGSPIPSLGTDPVSVAVSGSTLLVANKAQDPNRPNLSLPDYVSLSLRRIGGGLLRAIPRSVIASDIGSSPAQVLFSPNDAIAFGCNFSGGTLLSFAVSESGQLIPTGAQGVPIGLFQPSGASPFPLGLEVHPRRPVLYVGFPFINRVGIYRYDGRGRLSFVGSVANQGQGNCWLIANRAGNRLYTGNTGDRSLSVLDISNAERPVLIQNVVLRGTGDLFEIDIDGPNAYVYALRKRPEIRSRIVVGSDFLRRLGRDPAFRRGELVETQPTFQRRSGELISGLFLSQRNAANVPFTANALHVLQVNDDGSNWKAWNNRAWPTVYVVDRRGRVRYGWEGELSYRGQKGEETVHELVDTLLAERP